MSMLAEPRRKKRSINLRGKNHWSEDRNKLGKKLMEKMGWSEGKGLGANEDGSKDHLKVRFKDDNGGVGFKDHNNQWTEHETHFESLLKSLHGGNVDTQKLHSECSLEEKSKKLQSRLHYKKFTRGKDVTKYSHKDLANIFGKKSLFNKQEIKEDVTESTTSEEKIESNLNLVEGGCMKEYFKLKMSSVKSVVNEDEPKIIYEEEDSIRAFKGFSGNDKPEEQLVNETNDFDKHTIALPLYQRFAKSSDQINSSNEDKIKKRKREDCNENEISPSSDNNENEFKTKSKKSKKIKLHNIEETEQIDENNYVNNDNLVVERISKIKKSKLDEKSKEIYVILDDDKPSLENVPKKKKSKKSKIADVIIECDDSSDEVIIVEKKEKKKKKNASQLGDIVKCDDGSTEVAGVVKKEKKKKKNDSQLEKDIVECDDGLDEVINVEKKEKKKKKNASQLGDIVKCDDGSTEVAGVVKKEKKKMKNDSQLEKDIVECDDGLDEVINVEKKEKKKKKNALQLEDGIVECDDDSDDVIIVEKKEKKKKKNTSQLEDGTVEEEIRTSSMIHLNNETSANPKVKVTKSRRKKQTYKPLHLDDVRKLRSTYSQVVQQCIPEKVIDIHDSATVTKKSAKRQSIKPLDFKKAKSSYSQVLQQSVSKSDCNALDSIASARNVLSQSADLSTVDGLQAKCKLVKEHLKNTVDNITDVEMIDVSNRINEPSNAPSSSSSNFTPSAMSMSHFPNVFSSQTASNSWELLSLKKMLDDPFVSATRKQYLNQRILELNDVIIKELLLSTQRSSKSEEIVLLENICSMFDTRNLSAEQRQQLECVLSALREKVINEILKEFSNVGVDYEKALADLQSLLNLKCLLDTERSDIMRKVCELREKAAKNLIKQTHAPVEDHVQLLGKVQLFMNDPLLPQESKNKLLQKFKFFKNKTINKLTDPQIADSDCDTSLVVKLQTLLEDPNISHTKRMQIVTKIKDLEASAVGIVRSYRYEFKKKLTSKMTEVLNFVGSNLETIIGYGVNVKTPRFVEILLPDAS